MTAQKGSDLSLQVGDAGTPTEVFTTVGGLRNTSFSFSSNSLDITNITSNSWQELLDNSGKRSVSISGDGIFTDSTTENLVRTLAMSNTIRNYKIIFGNGGILTGAFKIVSYKRSASYNTEEIYSISIESSGAIIYI